MCIISEAVISLATHVCIHYVSHIHTGGHIEYKYGVIFDDVSDEDNCRLSKHYCKLSGNFGRDLVNVYIMHSAPVTVCTCSLFNSTIAMLCYTFNCDLYVCTVQYSKMLRVFQDGRTHELGP